MGRTTITETEEHSEIVSREIVTEGIADKDHAQWRTKWKNLIESLREQLANSISRSVHEQWMTKKNKKIAELEEQLKEAKRGK